MDDVRTVNPQGSWLISLPTGAGSRIGPIRSRSRGDLWLPMITEPSYL